MRKFFVALLSVICLTCMLVAVACTSNEPNYFILTYGAIDGVSLDFGEIQNGAKVREGYIVRFKCEVDETAVTGEPVILVNGNDRYRYPDENGIYSFPMTEDAEVTVSGVSALNSYDVTFDAGDWRITYTDVDGNAIEEVKDVHFGDSVQFKLELSVYYDVNSKYSVLANTQIITPDENGVYTANIIRDTTVSVTGLEEEAYFLARGNCGTGTADDPYLISRPIDLYAMANLINDPYYSSGIYALAHYKLVNDIDMKGEQLFVIGDATSSMALFLGEFDGNGHTIRNYYISDRIIEQDNFTSVFLSYTGLFGQAVATAYGPVSIHDLTLEGFEMRVDAASALSGFCAGSVVGMAIGAQIENCTVLNGEITANADTQYFGYMGGIAGYLRSAYTETLSYNAFIKGCRSEVEIGGESGYVLAGGGIVGYLESSDEYANAYVLNSSYSGSVYGAMQSGGIAGYMGPYTSVKNCYSTGSAEARNTIVASAGFEEYAGAYAGGIAGYLEYDSIISNCFSLSETSATAQNPQNAFSGDIVGGISDGEEYIETNAGLVLNCTADSSNVNQNYLTSTLGWSTDDWSFTGDYPAVKVNDKAKPVTVSLYCGGALTGSTILDSDEYNTICEWYERGIDRFVDADGRRSYGWYFDSNLTRKIPDAYVFSGSETIYCGLVDYNDVAGKYYLQSGVNGSGIFIELLTDGTLVYKEGARNVTSYYIYDGIKATFFDCPVFTEYNITYVTDENGNYVLDENGNRQEISTPYYSAGVATLDSGRRFILVNNVTYTQDNPRIALKEIEGFVYGAYYAGDTDYVFYADGTGRRGNASFTYSLFDSRITIDENGTLSYGTVTDGLVVSVGETDLSKYDPFAGTWASKSTVLAEYTFDGKGGWTYEHYGYVRGEKVVFTEDAASGSYVYNPEDETLELDNGVIVGFGSDGLLQITNTGNTDTYYGQFSYTGKWRYFYSNEAIEIDFGGITKDGTGKAVLSYETLPEDLNVTYHVLHDNADNKDYVYIYMNDDLLGMLYFEPSDLTLRGMIYSYAEDAMIYSLTVGSGDDSKTYYPVRFCLYDEFYGEWLGENWGSVEFDGFGSYAIDGLVIGGDVINTAVSGSVTINGKSVQYKLDNATMSGSFVFEGVTYTISYNEERDVIEIKSDAIPTFELVRPDSLYGLKLRSVEGGTVYEFDGGSRHANGGVVKAGSDRYFYKIAEDGVITLYNSPDSVAGKIEAVNGNYVLTLDSQTNVTLVIVNDFTGEWNVGESRMGMSIGEISASLIAQGLYLGEPATYTYSPAENLLSFVYRGDTYYITSMAAENGTELRISDTTDEFGSSVYCVRNEKLDGYQGKFTALDGSYLLIDGLSASSYARGFAGIYSEKGELTKRYSYTVNVLGMVELRSGDDYFVLVPSETTASGAYVNGSTAYVIKTPDIFYLVAADDYFGTEYRFDGLGKVTASDGKTYGYTVAEQTEEDTLNLVYRMTFKEENGTEHAVKFDYSTRDYVVTFTDEFTGISVTERVLSGITGNVTYETVYKFVCANTLEVTETSYDRNGNVTNTVKTVYSYTVTDSVPADKIYQFALVSDGGNYTGVLKLETENGPQFTLTKDN